MAASEKKNRKYHDRPQPTVANMRVSIDLYPDALAASLDYSRASFGPYPFDHARIVEYPGYANFAQAFAGTIPCSETYGFIADCHEPETIDRVTATTAHELSHQCRPGATCDTTLPRA